MWVLIEGWEQGMIEEWGRGEDMRQVMGQNYKDMIKLTKGMLRYSDRVIGGRMVKVFVGRFGGDVGEVERVRERLGELADGVVENGVGGVRYWFKEVVG